ncbi:tryptophan synthase beta subunit-like PLP-dependent enzyme [Pisolithus albus]|nr:tryptophan synthase beta subunit-like PLP-dependent enzyme [Pisolithus albus]
MEISLAKHLRKTCIITKTSAGHHGVTTSIMCAHSGMECIIYMGAKDTHRPAPSIFHMKMLGDKVLSIMSGSKALKGAVNEAMRDRVTNLAMMHFLIGSCFGTHPFLTIKRPSLMK